MLGMNIPPHTNQSTLFKNYKDMNKLEDDEEVAPLVINEKEKDINEDIFSPEILNILKGEVSYTEYRLGTLNTDKIENNREMEYAHNMISQYNYLLGQLEKHYNAVEKGISLNNEKHKLDHETFENDVQELKDKINGLTSIINDHKDKCEV